METTERRDAAGAGEGTWPRRARFLGLVLAMAAMLGVAYGLLAAAFGESAALLTWWGTLLRGVVAVLSCFWLAGLLERRWSARR